MAWRRKKGEREEEEEEEEEEREREREKERERERERERVMCNLQLDKRGKWKDLWTQSSIGCENDNRRGKARRDNRTPRRNKADTQRRHTKQTHKEKEPAALMWH